MNNFRKKLPGTPYFFWSVLFIIIPLCMVFYYGLTDKSGAFTLENIIAVTTREHSKALWLSLLLSLIATVICLLLSYPLAMILCSRKGGQHSVIVFIFILPMWMNFLLRTLAWQTLLEKTGVINSILSFLHLPALNIINTPQAIVLGMVYNFLPFMVLPIYNALAKIDENVINAARDLGAGPVYSFFKVVLPDILPGVLSGFLMAFTMSLDDFIITHFTKGAGVDTLSTKIYTEVKKGIKPEMYALSTLIFITVLILLLLINKAPADKKQKA